MLEDLVTNNWMETISNFYKIFIEWFSGLELSGQIMVGILIILSLIGIGYLIYGVLWLVYQIVKASIIIKVIIVYLIFTFLYLIILLIVDGSKVSNAWENASHNIQWIISKTYSSDNKLVITQSSSETKTQSLITQNPPVAIIKENIDHNTPETQPDQIIQETQVLSTSQHQDLYPIPKKRFEKELDSELKIDDTQFCPNCGAPFSSRMKSLLNDKTFVFCEQCGEKFFKRDVDSEIHA